MTSLSDILKKVEASATDVKGPSDMEKIETESLTQTEKEPEVIDVVPEVITETPSKGSQLFFTEVLNDSYSVPSEALETSDPSKNVVTQANVLVKASYELSLNAKRVLLLALSKIDSRRDDIFKDQYQVRLNVKDFLACYGGHEKSAYREFIKGLDDLFQADVVEIDNELESKKFRWVSSRYYHKNLGYADLNFTKEVMLYVSNLTSAFTSYKLMHVGGLRSVYSIRLFELLMTEERKGTAGGTFEIDLYELRLLFNLPDDKYPKYPEFNRSVIKKAVNEINLKTYLNVVVEPKRAGRVVSSIKFHFQKSGSDLLPNIG